MITCSPLRATSVRVLALAHVLSTAIVPVVLFSACAAEPCVEYCESLRDEAESLGVSLDCDDDEWSEADTCEECKEALARRGLAVTSTEECGGYFD